MDFVLNHPELAGQGSAFLYEKQPPEKLPRAAAVNISFSVT